MVNKTKQIQQLMPQKPAQPKPLTKEEQAQQIARFFTQKREQYFQLILANTLQNPNALNKIDHKTSVLACVEIALQAADYALEKLFPPPEEKKEDAE